MNLLDSITNLITNALANTHTATVGKIIKVNEKTIDVKPVINRVVDGESLELPVFLDVLPIFLYGGQNNLRFPLAKDDYCLLIFAERCTDKWYKGVDNDAPNDTRQHDYSDSFAIVGIKNEAGSFVIPSVTEHTGDFKQTGNVEIIGNTNQTGNVVQTGNVNLTGNVIHEGDNTQTGDVNLTGNIEQTGNITLTGAIIQTGDLTQTGNIQTVNITCSGITVGGVDILTTLNSHISDFNSHIITFNNHKHQYIDSGISKTTSTPV